MHIGAKIGAKKAVFCQNEETKKWQDRFEVTPKSWTDY